MKTRALTPLAVLAACLSLLLAMTLSAKPAYAADDWGVWLGGVNVRQNPTGKGYSYDEANHILTLENYTGEGTVRKDSQNLGFSYQDALLYDSRIYDGSGSKNGRTGLVIELKGTNRLGKSDVSKYGYKANAKDTDKPRVQGIFATNDGIIIRGSGTLTVNCQTYPIMGYWYEQQGGTVNCNSRMDGVTMVGGGGITLKSGSTLNAKSVGTEMPFYAVDLGGNLIIESEAALNASTTGNYYSAWGNPFPIAVDVEGAIQVYGRLRADATGRGSNDGANGGNQSFAIKANKLIIDQGGVVYAFGTGKNKSGTADGATTVQVSNLQVGLTGYFRARNDNSAKGALKVDTLGYVKDGQNNNIAAITYPQNAQHVGGLITYYGYNSATNQNDNARPATFVEISGMNLTSLVLGKTSYISDTSWAFYNTGETGWVSTILRNGSDSIAGGSAYASGGLDLATNTKGYSGNMGSYFNQIKPNYYTQLREIVVASGSQTLALNALDLTGRDMSDPFITVKSGATLTLKLTGMSYLESKNAQPVIKVEDGATLNIEAADGGTSAALTLVSNGWRPILCAGSNSKVNIKSGVVYTCKYDSGSTSRIGGDNNEGKVTVSGGYVVSDIGCSELLVTGGTIPAGQKVFGATKVNILGGSVGAELDGNPQAYGIDETKVYKTTAQLYEADRLRDSKSAEWVTFGYKMKSQGDGTFATTLKVLPWVQSIDLENTQNQALNYGYKCDGSAGIYGGGDDSDTIWLWLPENSKVTAVMIEPNVTTAGASANIFRANREEEIVTKKDGTGSGRLYLRTLVIGQYVTALRLYPDQVKYKGAVQLCAEYNNDSSDVWWDYDPDVEVTVGNDQNLVQKYGILAIDGSHKLTLKHLEVVKGADGKDDNQRLQVNGSATLDLLLDGKSSMEAADNADVIDLSGTLNLLGSHNGTSTNGWLTLKGKGNPFAPSATQSHASEGQVSIVVNHPRPNATLSVTDAVLANECTGNEYANYDVTTSFKKLTFSNATVINLGSVSCGDVTIDGGSVDIDLGGATVKNSNGNELTKTPFTVSGISDYTKVDAVDIKGLPTGATFATEQIWTSKDGKIVLWLPQGASVESVSIGSTTYYPVSDGQGGTTLLPEQAPSFSAPTGNQTIMKATGESFSLETVCAASPEATYQWQKYNGTGWENVSGATAATYSGTMSADLIGTRYRCVATNKLGTVASAEFGLFTQPAFTTQPADKTVRANENAKFEVAVTDAGSASVTYQWESSEDGEAWTKVDGATSATYEVQATNEMEGLQFRCVVTFEKDGFSASKTSNAAKLTVVSAPNITAQPSSMNANAGEQVTLSVKAEGNQALSYQWQSNSNGQEWNDITDATGTTYTFTATAAMNDTKLRCVVTNSANGVTYAVESNAATITVTSAPVTPTAPVISTQPTGTAVAEGGRATLTVRATGEELSYQWQSSVDGQTWTMIEGANSATYEISTATLTQDGTQYRCVVKNAGGEATSSVATLAVVDTPRIVGQPNNAWVYEGTTASFTVEATGNKDLSYQWQVKKTGASDFENVAGATGATYTTEEATSTMEGWTYRCLVSNVAGEVSRRVTSGEASLSVNKKGSDPVTPSRPSQPSQPSESSQPAQPAASEVKVGDASGGTISVSSISVVPGETVTIAVTPDEGHEVGTVTVTGEDGSSIPVTDNGDGTFSFVVPSGSVTVDATFTEKADGDSPFIDVHEDDWFFETVTWAAREGIVHGYGDTGRFGPNDTLTRGQLVTMLWNAEGQPASVDGTPFSDVPVGEYYTEAVRWAAENGIVFGYGDTGRFGPEDVLTREQMVAILHRYVDLRGISLGGGVASLEDFDDVDGVSAWALEDMRWACDTGVIRGSNGSLLSQYPCTRAHVATVLFRLLA